MSIRWRLALYGAAVTGLMMIVFGTLLTLLASSAAPSDQERNLEELTAQAAAGLAGVPPQALAAEPPLLAVDLADSTDPFVAVVAADGTVLYSTGLVGGAPPRIPAAVVVEALESGESRAVASTGPGAEVRLHAVRWEPAGVLVAGQSTEFARQEVAGLVAVVWVSGIVTLLVAALVSWLVSGRAMRPLRRLAETIGEIGRTRDLSRRLPPLRARDEVGALTTSFNEMLDQVEEAQARLEASLATQRRFVADASHELRGPLTTIRNNAGLLTDVADVRPEDRREALEEISAAAEGMTGMIDDLLALARADAGRGYDLVPLDLGDLAREVAERARRLHGGVTVDRVDRAVLDGDRTALERLVWILLENANRHGGGQARVAVTADDRVVRLEVADSGPGIPEADLGRVFERFFRSDPARSPAGTGLGLAIAAEIAAAHGGTIRAANRPEGGTVFTALFPASP